MKSFPVQVIFREYFEGIFAAIFLAAFLRIFVLNVLYIPTDNMAPGLERGDFVIGWKLAYGFPLPLSGGERLNQKMAQRGDIVAFRFPGDEEQLIIRRVIAVPGDRITMSQGKVTINGQVVKYREDQQGVVEKLPGEKSPHDLKPPLVGELGDLVVPPDKFFVLSDHRSKFDDSRSWGIVPLNNIESKIWWIWLSVDSTQESLVFRWPRMFQWVN